MDQILKQQVEEAQGQLMRVEIFPAHLTSGTDKGTPAFETPVQILL